MVMRMNPAEVEALIKSRKNGVISIVNG